MCNLYVYHLHLLAPPLTSKSSLSIIGLITPDMLESITWGTYIFFAAFSLIALVFTFFCIPETRGKVPSLSLLLYPNIPYHADNIQTLEDMDLIFGDTAAHEEKQRIVQIEAHLHGTGVGTITKDALDGPSVQQDEHVA